MRIHLATDHAGFDLKETVKTYLQDHGYDILDHGAHEFNKLDDYPDYIFHCCLCSIGRNLKVSESSLAGQDREKP
jgi:ribose 5-phosphate isomerase RpiB